MGAKPSNRQLLEALELVREVQSVPDRGSYRRRVLGHPGHLPRGLQAAGAEDQLSFILPSPPELVVGVAMNRPTRGFSAAERELIALVRPHLSQAFRDAQLRSRVDPLGDEQLRAKGLSAREAEVIRLLVEGCRRCRLPRRSRSPCTPRITTSRTSTASSA